MEGNKLLFVSLFILQIVHTTEAAYKGCFKEDQKNRLYDINPGDFDPNSATPTLCASKCGAYGKSFAALTYGRFCFCGDSEPATPAQPNSNCQDVCSGDPNIKCGGKGYVSLYTSAQPITGLTISSDAAGVITTGITVNFAVSVTSGNEVYYQMDYDDDAGLSEKNATGFNTRIYHVPGTFSVEVQANDFNDTLIVQKAETTVMVQAPVADLDVDCDKIFATYEEGKCLAIVWQGTAVSFKAEITSLSIVHSFPAIADPVLSQVGPAIPSKDVLKDPIVSQTRVALGHVVESPGRVIGWELSVHTSGTLKVLILSPDCPPDQYCSLSNDCSASCEETCSGQSFCPRTRVCDDGTCSAPARFDATTPKVSSYIVKSIIDVVTSTTGYQYVAETGDVYVTSGDVFGLDIGASASANVHLLDCPSNRTDFTASGSPHSAGSTVSSFTSTGGMCIALRATVSGGSQVYLPLTINSEGTYTLTVSASNTDIAPSTTVTNSTDFEVFEGVNFTIIDGPIYLKTGVAETFSVESHTGKGAQYTWDMGDGSPLMINTTDQSKPLTYAAKGVYNLTITTANAVSSKSNTSLVFVQDEVTGLDVTAPTAPVNEEHSFQITLTGGSDYTCHWTFGDGSSVVTSNETTTPVGTTAFNHTYTTIGNKNFNLICANDVSTMTKTMTQKVQERITELRLTQLGQDSQDPVIIPWEVTTGSDIVWSATRNPATTLVVDNAASNPIGHTWKSVSQGVLPGQVLTIDITGANDINNESISVPYEITTAIAGFSVTASTDNTTTGTNVIYSITMNKGSNVNVTLVYGDGKVDSKKFSNDWVAGTTETFTHAFLDGGHFTVQVSASNVAGSFSQELKVLVLQGVNDIIMFSPSFALYSPPSYIDVWFEVPPNRSKPTQPKLWLDFNNVHEPIECDLELNTNYTERFDDMGTFNIVAIIENPLDSKTFIRPLVIIDILEGAVIEPSFSKAPRGQPFSVDFVLYRGPTSPNCNLTWDFGDGNGDNTTERQGEGENGRDTATVTYTVLGLKTISVTATTPLQTLRTDKQIDVIEPVVAEYLTYTDNTPVTHPGPVNVDVRWSGLVNPDNPKVTIEWGDGTSDTGQGFTPPTTTFSHSFSEDGLMQVKVIVFNEASSVEKTLELGVWKQFQNMAATKCFVPDLPADTSCLPGLDGSGHLFSSDKPVQFTISTSNNAKASFYDITATHSNNVDTIVCNRTTNPFTLDFKQPGKWTVAIQAINPLSSVSVSLQLNIVEKVVDFLISHDLAEKSGGVKKAFNISFGIQGTDTCLMVDFGDGRREVYADDINVCILDTEFTGLVASGMLTGTTVIYHTYTQQRTYILTATAKNIYNSVTSQIDLEITGLDCSQPQVEIYNGTINFKTPNRHTKGSSILIRGIPIIACSFYENVKNWTVETIDPAWGNVTGIVDLKARNVDTSMAQLLLRPWILDFGRYKVTFYMSMVANDPALKFMASAFSYIEVVKSQLVGLMVEGGTSEIVRGKAGSDLVLNPLAFSYDPDVENNSVANSNLIVVNWTCTLKDGSTADPGCSAIKAGSTTGKTGSVSCSMSALVLSSIYRINVTLQKDGEERYVRASILVVIVDGDPAHVIIRCTAGSICHQLPDGYLVLESARLNLVAECQNCADTDILGYKWNISLNAFRWPDGWRPLQPIDMAKNRTVGYESKELSIQPSLFQAFPEYKLLKVECAITRQGVTGWAATFIQLNQPPKGGHCTINPKVMNVTREKLFRIECKNWVDDTGIALFQFFSFFDPETVMVQITSVKTSSGSVSLNVTLAQGAHYLDYNNTVRVVVSDVMGATTEVVIDTVKVYPVNTSDVRALTNELRYDKTSEMTKLFAEGDLISCTEFVTTIAAMLNSDSKQSQTEYYGSAIASTKSTTGLGPYDEGRVGPYEQPTKDLTYAEEMQIEMERDNRAEVRAMILESVTKLPNDTMLGRTQTMSAIAETMRYPDEVTSKTQMLVANALENYANKLDDGEEVTPEQREQNMQYLIACVGALMDAAGTTGFEGTLTELREAEDDELFMDYPTENVARDDDCLLDYPSAYTFDEAFRRQQLLTNCRLTRENATIIAMQTQRILEKIRNSYVKNSIQGESQQFDTDRMRTLLKKTTAKHIFNETQTLEYTSASCEFPPSLNDLFPDGSVQQNDTIVVQMSENSNTPYRYTTTAKAIPLTTRFVSVDLYSDTGKLSVSNMLKPIKLVIPRSSDQPKLIAKNVDPKLVPWNKFQLHKTEFTTKGVSVHSEFCLQNSDVQYVVVINFGGIPDPQQGLCNRSFLVPASMSDPVRPKCTPIFMDNWEVDDYVGMVYFGVRQLTESEIDMDVSNCSKLPHWSNGTSESQFTGNYTMKMFTSACFSISVGDVDWSTKGCRVHGDTNDVQTVCECTHLTTFAGGWVVVPNTIDWNYVFSNLDFYKNPTLYVTEIIILLVYILALIWARRKDKKDVEKLGIAPLVDNDPNDKYFYEIVVVTGMRRSAGTDSKIFFILSGEEDETDVREFSDNKRKIFRRGGTNGFLMATPRPLGYLNYARIWNDNSGKGNMGSWYMNYMIVRDVQTDEKWVFIADRWFAVEEDDGQVDRIVPVATRESMTQFSHMFAERSRRNLADGHLWFSVVARPPQSRFTCVQRVSCCLCLLFASMLTNAMFYRTETDSPPSSGISFGPFSVTPEQIFIGVVSNLIVFPINFIIITLFRKARPRKLRPSRVDEAIKTAYDGPRSEASVNDVKPEVSSLFSISRPASMMADSPKPRPESSLSRPATSFSVRADATLPFVKKKRFDFPWWCRIVAWLLLWVVTLVSLAFVTFYGISFADETCKKWISSMLVSFFTSVFITQPLKVFLFAIFLSLIVKNPGEEDEEDEEYDEERTKLANDEIPLHNLNPDTYGAAHPRKIGYKPPDRKELEAARQRRLKEIQMWAVIREVVIYSFFLWILMVISYRQRNADTFLYKDTMERVFIQNNETDIDFSSILNVDDFFVWTRSGLVNGIRAGPYYNDYPPLLLRGYVNDKVSKILGYATMRQLRIKPSLCDLDERMVALIRECNTGYDMADQEEGSYDISWKPTTANSTENDTAPWYRYTSASQLNGYPYWGQLAWYSGGGYLVNLKGSKDDLTKLMDRLEGEQWIDRYTRAVFVEFTTYNAQVNLFGIATILAEFHPTGGIVQSYRFEPAKLLPYMTQAMLFQLVCEVVYCLFIIFFIVKLIRTVIKEKLAFFKGFWNLIETGIVSMSLGAIIIYFYRMIETNKLTKRFKESNGLDYIKFQYVGYWNEVFAYMIGWIVFFATLKFLRLLRFNKRMSILASTLKNGAESLLHFSIIFWIVFLAFAMLFFLNYMTVDIQYSSFISSLVSGILMMMGKFDMNEMSMVEPLLTQIFVFLFVVTVTFIMVNMFVTILNETFGAVRADVTKQSNEYEIISFMISRFRHFTGISGARPITLTPEELRNQEEEKRFAEGRTCVDDFPERIDRLLHSISNVYMDQDRVSSLMNKKSYHHVGSDKGYDNLAYTGPQKGRPVSEMSRVHTH